MTQLTLAEEGTEQLFGTQDENLRRIESAFGVEVAARGNQVTLSGSPEAVHTAGLVIEQLSLLVAKGYRLKPDDVATAIRVVAEDPSVSLVDFFVEPDAGGAARRLVQPRSLNQQLYVRSMQEHDIVVAVGPAGTGKTYLAVAAAAAALVEKRVKRLVLVRPAV
jgi:phosphate starvation-inducible PhoH-like protein